MADVLRAAARGDGQDPFPQAGGIRNGLVRGQANGWQRTAGHDLDQGGIHAVRRSSGHQANDLHVFLPPSQARPRNSAVTRASAAASARRSTAVMAMALAAKSIPRWPASEMAASAKAAM